MQAIITKWLLRYLSHDRTGKFRIHKSNSTESLYIQRRKKKANSYTDYARISYHARRTGQPTNWIRYRLFGLDIEIKKGVIK